MRIDLRRLFEHAHRGCGVTRNGVKYRASRSTSRTSGGPAISHSALPFAISSRVATYRARTCLPVTGLR